MYADRSRKAAVRVGGLGLRCLAACLPAVAVAGESETAASARGVVRAINEATLASDLAAQVVRIPFREGQSFAKGDVLVAFGCDRYAAELKAAGAEARGQKATYESQLKMAKLEAAGALDVTVAKAQAEKAEAAVDAAKVRVGQCQIVAPFDGRVVEVLTHEFDTPAPSAPLLRIVDHKNLELDMIVPSKWLRWLRDGRAIRFQIDETGSSVPANVKRVGAAVDPVSQTVKVTGTLSADGGALAAILPGMSGVAVFPGAAP